MLWAAGGGTPPSEAQLVLTAPFHSSGRSFEQRESGALFAWRADALPTAGSSMTTDSATSHVPGAHGRGRFGSSLCAVPLTLNGTALVVGSPRASFDGNEQSGAVDLVNLI